MISVQVLWLLGIVLLSLLLTAITPSVVCTTMLLDSMLKDGLSQQVLLIVGQIVVILKAHSITHYLISSVFRRNGIMVIHWHYLHGVIQPSVLLKAQVLMRHIGLLMIINIILIGVIKKGASVTAVL